MTEQEALWEVVDIIHIVLVGASVKSRLQVEDLPATGPELTLGCDMRCSHAGPGNPVEVRGTLVVEGKIAGESEPCLQIEIEHRLLYSLPDDYILGEEALQEFAWQNGIFNVWPYWREMVDSIYARMKLPLPTR